MDSTYSLERTPRKSKISQMLLLVVLPPMLLLSGLGMTGCCSTPVCPTPEPEVIVVDESSILENPDGTYTVSEGWMLERLEFEQSLRAALERCEQQAGQ